MKAFTQYEKSECKSLAQSVYDDNMETETSESISVHQRLININDADKDALITLPKIDPITAERIIKYREKYLKKIISDRFKKYKGNW
jgi:DNA uptake protein ComE-like DNA-binding protein